MALSGQLIDDRYRLDKRIAAGGVGQVWLATDSLLERPVAVKLLRPEHADHPATLARFRKEARHAGALSHPCVAQVFDYGPGGPCGPPYLVMEFVDGPSLADLLAVDPVEPGFALDVIAQTARGLHAAHQIGLVHRDVKPGNILIGPDGRVKITDFGIACAAGQTPITAPGLVMGTTQYMAPERIAGGGPGTPSSDLYALGIVLHECLTGLPPYEGTPAEVMAGHLHASLPPLPASIPPELAALVARLTDKDPAMRIGDAGDLAALAARLRDSVATGQPGPVRQPGQHQDAHHREPLDWQEPAGIRRRAVALAATVLAAAGIAGLLVSGVLNTAPSAHRPPGKPAESRGAPALGTLGVVPATAGGGGSVTGSLTGTAPSAKARATRHRTSHGGAAGGGPAPSAAPSAAPTATTSPVPGASPTPTRTPTGQPGTPTPAPSPTKSGILPSLPIPIPIPTLRL